MRTVNAWLTLVALAAAQGLAQVPTPPDPAPPVATTPVSTTGAPTTTAPAPSTGAPPSTSAPPTAAAAPEFKVPPGWRQRGKKGDDPVYCRKESVTGTRFEKERCLTRTQMRQAEALNRDYGKEILRGPLLCLGDKTWCSSGK